jgi:hypothetical protein
VDIVGLAAAAKASPFAGEEDEQIALGHDVEQFRLLVFQEREVVPDRRRDLLRTPSLANKG